jgi:cell division protein FtsQ
MLGLATVVLLVAAMKQKGNKVCSGVNIEIVGPHNYVFVDENDIKQILKENNAVTGNEISQTDLNAIEEDLQKNAWIKQADLFFDNNQLLQVKINERDPLARVFTLQGNSFYIDSSGMRLPVSENQTARVPVFTSFTSNKNILSAPDSALLNDIKKIAQFISTDPFWTEQVSQINITTERNFQIVPVLGNQIIELGNADSLQSKFDRLYSFYKQVWAKAGFEKYEKIDVRYDGQVVATIHGAAAPATDTANAALNNTIYNPAAVSMAKDATAKKPIAKTVVKLKPTIASKPKPGIKRSNKAKTKKLKQ